MKYIEKIYSLLLETPRDPSFSKRRRKRKKQKEEPKEEEPDPPKSVLVGTSQSCDAAGGCKKVHPGKTHWDHVHRTFPKYSLRKGPR